MKRFFVGEDISGGPAVRLRRQFDDGRTAPDGLWVSCATWPGAYFGAAWRNLLGGWYVPFSPSRRWELSQ